MKESSQLAKNLVYIGILVAVCVYLFCVAGCHATEAAATNNRTDAALVPPAQTAQTWPALGTKSCSSSPTKGWIGEAVVVSRHYAVAPASGFRAYRDMSTEPRVCLADGQKGIEGRLVFLEDVAIIRFEDGLNVKPDQLGIILDDETAADVLQALHDYFAGWGRHIPDKPEF